MVWYGGQKKRAIRYIGRLDAIWVVNRCGRQKNTELTLNPSLLLKTCFHSNPK